jgi:electron transfer flavoprotein beta subunit
VKIVVVYKWARDPEDAAVRADGSIDWRGAKMTAGEDDPAVLAAASDIAAAAGGAEIVGLTMGDGDATWALARGVESATAVPDAPFLLDNAATAAILAAAVGSIGDVDVVVIGDAEAYPGVAPALAGALGWPAILGVATASAGAGRLVVTRRVGDDEQTVSLAAPAVLGVAAAGVEKQAPGMKEVLAARKRPVTAVPLAALGAVVPDRLDVRSSRQPLTGSARVFDGDAASAATQLVAALRADGVL